MRALFCVFIFGAFFPLISQHLDDPDLDPKKRKEIIHHQEEMWGKKEDDMILPGKEPDHIKKERIEAKVGNPLGYQMGLFTVYLPERTFARNVVIIEIIVLEKHSDFALAGIPTVMQRDGKEILMDSQGMFHLSFYDTAGKSLEPLQPIPIVFRPIASTVNTKLYKLEKNEWKKQKEPVTTMSARECVDCNFEVEGFPEIYTKINGSGWWNFDKENEEFTCLKGKLENFNIKNQPSVKAAGMSYFGLSYANVQEDGSFYINVLKDSEVKIFSMEKKDHKQFKQAGYLPVIKSQNITAFAATNKDRCQDIGIIQLKAVGESTFKDRKKFLEWMEMPDR